MTVSASSLINLYKFPLGRAIFVLRVVAERARKVGALEVAELATRAADEAQAGLDRALRSEDASSGRYPADTVAADNLLDRTLTGISGYLDVKVRVYPGEPVALAAERVSNELFPTGVAEISQLPFAEEHERVNILLERAASTELASDMQLLPEMPDMIARLYERNREYGELLRKDRTMASADEVRAIKARVQELLTSTVALILGLHQLRTSQQSIQAPAEAPAPAQVAPVSADHRAYLLAPVLEQNEMLRQSRRRRRAPTDVDPNTGEELADDTPGENATPDTAADPSATPSPAARIS